MQNRIVFFLALLAGFFTLPVHGSGNEPQNQSSTGGPAFGMASTITSEGGTNGLPERFYTFLGEVTKPNCGQTLYYEDYIILRFPKLFNVNVVNLSIGSVYNSAGQTFDPAYISFENFVGVVPDFYNPGEYIAAVKVKFAIPGCLGPNGTQPIQSGDFTFSITLCGNYVGPMQPTFGPPVLSADYSFPILGFFKLVDAGQGNANFSGGTTTRGSLSAFNTADYDNPLESCVPFSSIGGLAVQRQATPTVSSFDWEVRPQGDYAILGIHQRNAASTTLEVYNLQGQLVATPIQNQSLDAGQHQLKVGLQGLPRGLYIFRLRQGSVVSAKRLLRP